MTGQLERHRLHKHFELLGRQMRQTMRRFSQNTPMEFIERNPAKKSILNNSLIICKRSVYMSKLFTSHKALPLILPPIMGETTLIRSVHFFSSDDNNVMLTRVWQINYQIRLFTQYSIGRFTSIKRLFRFKLSNSPKYTRSELNSMAFGKKPRRASN